MTAHKHLILCGVVENPPVVKDEVIAFLRDLVRRLGMRTLRAPEALFYDGRNDVDGYPDNVGFTGTVLLTTSHATYHDWTNDDGSSSVQVDVYSCKPFMPNTVIDLLREHFALASGSWRMFDRDGIISEIGHGTIRDYEE